VPTPIPLCDPRRLLGFLGREQVGLGLLSGCERHGGSKEEVRVPFEPVESRESLRSHKVELSYDGPAPANHAGELPEIAELEPRGSVCLSGASRSVQEVVVPFATQEGTVDEDSFHRIGIPTMCRNIQRLFNYEPEVTDDEVRASALQYVRKVSGFTRPSKPNEVAFDEAVQTVTDATRRLLESLVTQSPPRSREADVVAKREAAKRRYGAAPAT
jgi:hypothetical protein